MELQVDVTKLPAVDEHVRYGQDAIVYAKELPVETKEDMEVASGMREAIKDRKKSFLSFIDPIIDAMNKAHKAGTAKRKAVVDPLDEAVKIIDRKMTAWDDAENARIAEEQRKRDEEEKLRAAVQASEEGNEALAEAIIEDQIPVTAAPVEKSKTAGVSFVTTWKYEYTDHPDKVVKYLAENGMFGLLMINEQAMKSHVIANKDRANIPFMRVYMEKGIKSAPKGMAKRSF